MIYKHYCFCIDMHRKYLNMSIFCQFYISYIYIFVLIIVELFWNRFVIIWELFWDHFGIILESFLDLFLKNFFDCFCIIFLIFLGSFCAHFGIILDRFLNSFWYFLYYFWIFLGSFCDHFGIILESLWDCFRTVFEYFHFFESFGNGPGTILGYSLIVFGYIRTIPSPFSGKILKFYFSYILWVFLLHIMVFFTTGSLCEYGIILCAAFKAKRNSK